MIGPNRNLLGIQFDFVHFEINQAIGAFFPEKGDPMKVKVGNRFGVILAFTLMLAVGAAREKESSEHFGTQMNHPKFKGPGDFFGSFARVARIFLFKKLDGQSVLRPWVDNHGWLTPAFREQLCLVVTLNNHCVG